ncbi:MPN385 family protein [Mycoplasmoides pirum]|uniref:MPN385 family protein n=1 Tax=Mycoplasmoides pirum TaxID=2122 RepID=UPI000486ACEE|nr:hypothetical protein [Mycoplasmoides pirum]
MWLVRFVKKLLSFAISVAIIAGLVVVFLGSMWFSNNYNFDQWQGLLTEPKMPTGALTAIFPDVANWYKLTLEQYSGDVLSLFHWLIPIGFGLVFAIAIQVVLSIIFHFIKKIFRKKKNVKATNVSVAV